jgi:site-specific DNA-methyltransferase (adenine-specific)
LLGWSALWLAECWRLAKDNGVLLLFTDWRQLPTFTDAVQAGGWIWRSLIVWDKTPKVRPNKGYFRHQAEYIIFATKGNWQPPTAVCLPGVFTVPVTQQYKNHLTAKPVPLITKILGIIPEKGLILDPFMGGGSIPRACYLSGYNFIGIELEPTSYKTALQFVHSPSTPVLNFALANAP